MKQYDPVDYRIFEGVVGSQLYGTNTPESDLDTRGIAVMPMEVMLNPFMSFEQKDSGFEEEDRAIYSLAKFFKLCADGNPNIAEFLFVPDNKTLYKDKRWDVVLANKSLFLSKKIKHTFLGYSHAQATAIERHRKWFVDPPKNKPKRADFGLTDSPLVSGENLDNALQIPHDLFKDEFRAELLREREYRLAKKAWDNFVSWRDNRNPKRKGYEERFGYDLKYASHLIRLMEEGRDLLLTGNLEFPLRNAKELLEIKNGKYSYEDFMVLVESLDNQFEKWYNESSLPNAPDRNGLTDVYFEILKMGDQT